MKSTLETYSELKNQFLAKFSTVEAWGDWVSQQRVTAFTEILDYFDEADKLLEKDEGLKDIFYEDHIDILTGTSIAMPRDIRDSLVGSATNWQSSSSWEQFGYLLFCLKSRQRISSELLGDFVRIGLDPWHESVPADEPEEFTNEGKADREISDMKTVISKLRRIRFHIYKRMRAGGEVSRDLNSYQSEVTRFTRRFQEYLSEEDLALWNDKVTATVNDAENYNFSKLTMPRPCTQSQKITNNEKISSKTAVLEAEKEAEYLVDSLQLVLEDAEDPDMILRERLLRLKLFNQAWLNPQKCEQPSQLTKPSLTELVPRSKEASAADEEENVAEVNDDHNIESDMPVIATEDEVKDFNEWFEAKLSSKVAKQSREKSLSSNLSATPQESSISDLNSEQNMSDTFTKSHSAHECCPCLTSRSQQHPFHADQDKDTMFLFMQAILVMLATLTEFLHSNLSSPKQLQPHPHAALSNHVVTASVAQPSSKRVFVGNMVEFWELVVDTGNLASQWGLWTYQAVLMKVLTVISGARSLFRNLARIENWVKVKNIFLE